jgi:hypothetical protein
MRIKSWKRLAGCIAIRTVLAAGPEYHAGVASAGQARAVVIEDRYGNRALFAQAAAPIDRPTADFVAVRFVRSLQIDRAAILLAGGSGEDLVLALETALAGLQPVAVAYDGRIVSITADGQCRATLFPISFDGCTSGTSVRAPVRAAFQMVDLARSLQHRGETSPVYPVQAIALGNQVTILALGGNASDSPYRAPKRIVVLNANDSFSPPPDPRIDTAVRQVLARIGR